MARDHPTENPEGRIVPESSPLDPLQRAMAALGEEHRFRLAELIRARPCSVGELVEATGLPQPLVSYHLAVLCAADVARAERQGRRRLYRLAQPENPLIQTLVGLLGDKPAYPQGKANEVADRGWSEQKEAAAPSNRGDSGESEEIEDYLL